MFKYLFKIRKLRALLQLHKRRVDKAESWLTVQRETEDYDSKMICHSHVIDELKQAEKIENLIKLL